MNATVAIIGGSGLDELGALTDVTRSLPSTPYGPVSGPLIHGRLGETEIIFIARHGVDHRIPPHRINYRANIWALADCGVREVYGVTAVGGIVAATPPGRIVVPDQIIDYTAGREHTYFDGVDNSVHHIDFTFPYSDQLRRRIVDAGARDGCIVEATGTYGATEGPRLETAAEIGRMARDGCTVVGMTGMPEAALAREAGLDYANCSIVVNWAAGVTDQPISLDDIGAELESGMHAVVSLLRSAVNNA